MVVYTSQGQPVDTLPADPDRHRWTPSAGGPMRLPATLLCLAGLATPLLVYGATIRVPADQPTIQAGINAAAAGDSARPQAPARVVQLHRSISN